MFSISESVMSLALVLTKKCTCLMIPSDITMIDKPIFII